MHSVLTQGLRAIVFSVLEDSPSEDQLARLVRICHALASPFVTSKYSGSFPAHLVVGLSVSDIAYDCIGELFRRDDRGCLLQIRAYFAAIEVSKVSEAELLMHLRRLVFSAVNQGIYRLYRQADPAFGKILRNIKLSVATLQNFTEIERFGESYLIPAMVDPLLERPPIETSYLERAMGPLVNASQSVPVLLGALSMVLRQQNEWSRVLPLSTVAALFRTIYARGQVEDEHSTDPQNGLMQEQLRGVIDQAAQKAMNRMLPVYSAEEGWSENLAEAYREIVKYNLELRLIENDGEDYSYFTKLRSYIPNLTREEYGSFHKNKVEYIGRLAYELLVSELRKELM